MAYQDMYDNLANPAFRGRAEMCIREQGAIYVADGRLDIAALGRGVVGNSWMDIEALMAAIAAGPNSTAAVTDDGALLSATQAVWPSVAAARYPGATTQGAGLLGAPPITYSVPSASPPAAVPQATGGITEPGAAPKRKR